MHSPDRKIPQKRKWQPTPVFLPGKSHGQRNLVGYSPWGRKESTMTECAHAHTCAHTHVSPRGSGGQGSFLACLVQYCISAVQGSQKSLMQT